MVNTPLITFFLGKNLVCHAFPGQMPLSRSPPKRPSPRSCGGRRVRVGQSRGVSTASLPFEVSLTPSGLGRRLRQARAVAERCPLPGPGSPGSAGRWRPAPGGGCPEGTARLQWSSCTPYRPPAVRRAGGGHGGGGGAAAAPRREKKTRQWHFLRPCLSSGASKESFYPCSKLIVGGFLRKRGAGSRNFSWAVGWLTAKSVLAGTRK